MSASAGALSGGSVFRSSRGMNARRLRSALATTAIVLTVVIAIVPLVALVGWVVSKGASEVDWSFLTDDLPFTQRSLTGGMGPAVIGTLVITGWATLMAVPLGVLGGIYLNEYGGRGVLARAIRFFAEVMTGVPSVVMGLFIYTIWVSNFKEQTGFAGSLALGALMLPIVIRTTEEMLRLVPHEMREGSYALGSRKARTIRTVVLPHAAPGIVSGALLAVARAAGETAPLIFTVGIVTESNSNVFKGPNTALPAQIFSNASSPFIGAQHRAYGAAFTLIVLVFAFTALARVVTAIFTNRASGA
jgi:phosphate transport system permease protein